ncbi:MAG: phosphoglycolate phosphatase [Nitrospirae bacterium RBG_16_64_22]|nr:MAG: phosphoglycolate phosphatase [Nitrospirae bacterium RBG_16_64_22]
MDTRRFRLIIFDLDGTLIDSRVDVANAANAARASVDLASLPLETVQGYVGDGVTKLVERILPENKRDAFDAALAAFLEFYAAHSLDHTTLYPGVRETVETLAQSRKLAVVTNKRRYLTMQVLEGLGIAGFFAQVVGGDGPLARKPSPEPLLSVCEAEGIPPNESLMVGDSPTDVSAARAAGISVCGVTYGYKPPEVVRASNPDFLIDALPELLKLLPQAPSP